MAILKIARMGHPVLRHCAAEVPDPAAPEIRRLVADMIETLDDVGGAGLAAPQVHVPLRVVIFSVPLERIVEEPGAEAVPLTVLINPVVTPLTRDTAMGWEGCLSVPGLRGAVPRFSRGQAVEARVGEQIVARGEKHLHRGLLQDDGD